MKFKSILTATLCAMALVISMPAQAQFLKKLGDALNKVDKALSGKEVAPEDRQIGKAVMIGDMKMAAFGRNPGVNFNYAICQRQDGLVTLAFECPNVSGSLLDLHMDNYGQRCVKAYSANGAEYEIARMTLGSVSSSEGVAVQVSAGATIAGSIVIKGVPADASTLGKVIMAMSGHPSMDADNKFFSFTLENVPITEIAAAEAVMTQTGVGPVQMGMQVTAVPASAPGLYDSIRRETQDFEGDEMPSLVFLSGGKTVFEAVGDETGAIWMIMVNDPGVKFEAGRKSFGVGDSINELRRAQGVKSHPDDGFPYSVGEILINENVNGQIESFQLGQW